MGVPLYQFQCNQITISWRVTTKKTSGNMQNCCAELVGLIVIRADESLFYQPNPPTSTPLVSPLPVPIMPLICSVPASSMAHFRLSSVYSPNGSFATPHNEFLLLTTLTKYFFESLNESAILFCSMQINLRKSRLGQVKT